MKQSVARVGAAFAASAGVALPASAGLIPIVNAGFEDPPLNNGQFVQMIPGWTTGAAPMGVWNPTPAAFAGGNAAEGENAAWSNSPDAFASQVLGAFLEPFTRYTLSMYLGNRADNNFPGYRFELRAGGDVLAFEENAAVPPEGQWVLRSIVFESGAAEASLGESLEIRFRGGGLQPNFDDVRLLAEIIPAPGTGAALILTWACAARRRR